MINSVKLLDAFRLNLKFLMFEKGLTQQDLGDKMGGVSRQNVSLLFKDDKELTTKTIANVAKALGVEETDLVDPNFKQKYFSKKD